MSPERKASIQTRSAVWMLVVGIAFSAAGFIVPPMGSIDDSVLWVTGQCFLYAGSIFGVGTYVNHKFQNLTPRNDEKD